MAERRMFAKSIIDSDAFLEMSASAQSLYFHLAMRADDEGFVNNPKRIQRMVGSADDDLKILIAKRYVLVFESGVLVIKHWMIHNYIQNDRFKPTMYQEERAMLVVKPNKSYTECIQDGYTMDTQVRLGKTSQEKEKEREKRPRFSPPCVDDVKAYCDERNNGIDAQTFVDFYTAKGWKVGKEPMKDWKACVRTWEQRRKDERPKQEEPAFSMPRSFDG